ncbi:MAG: hypothetical protein WD269_07040 [Acidimicrobiia bacterium]
MRTGPLGKRLDNEGLTRLESAIAEAEEAARRLGTDGSRYQVQYLKEQRQQLLDQIATREYWIEGHVDLLHSDTAIKDELAARATALAISYQLNPPEDVLEALGPRPSNTVEATRSDAAVTYHAEARIRLGPDVDLANPAVVDAASWRVTVNTCNPLTELEPSPLRRLVR